MVLQVFSNLNDSISPWFYDQGNQNQIFTGATVKVVRQNTLWEELREDFSKKRMPATLKKKKKVKINKKSKE